MFARPQDPFKKLLVSGLAIILPVHLGRYFAAIALCMPVSEPAFASPPAGPADLQAPLLVPAAGISDPVLPLSIPGYELRVLDRRKPIRFNVSGVWAESSLPVFIYVPAGDPGRAAGLLRQAYDGLLKLGLEPEWTAAELKAVLADLDAAIRALEPDKPAPAPKAGKEIAQAAPPPAQR
jgi:hypothetical protein